MPKPTFIPIAFATNGQKNPIQKTLQPSQDAQDATWSGGFSNITMIPIDSGGKAPKGQDFNGVMNAVTENIIYTQNGGRPKFDENVISEFGGYEFGFIIQSNDGLREYRSIIDNNTVDPNNGIQNAWIVYSGVGSLPTASSTTAGVMRVINNLNSTEVGAALSAAQGKALNDTKVNKTDIVNNLVSSSTTSVLSAAQGKTLNDKLVGVGQAWQNVTSSRVSGTTYTNNTGRPIQVSLSIQDNSQDGSFTVTVGGVVIVNVLDFGATGTYPISFIVPVGATYSVNRTTNTIRLWAELR